MKYAIVTYEERPMRIGGKTRLNIGDPIQTYAMSYIYSLMGVKHDELIKISRYHSKNYDGEYVILPFNCFNRIYNQLGQPYETLPLSHKIIPVFLSFHLHSRVIDDAILNNLRNYQPIGCRDEETMLNMRKHGLLAYTTGCVTALLPRRKKEPKKKKVFFIDIPESLKEYIPDHLKENAEYTGHHILFNRDVEEEFLTEEEYQKFYKMGIDRLKKYEQEATLVVTSRLHAATPCMAMGIPVILVSNNFDGRFSGLDKYLPLYTPTNFSNIDWNPQPIEYEEEKKKITQIFINQIKSAYEKNNDIYSLSSYYENRPHYVYNAEIINAISSLPFAKYNKVKYGVWGLTTMAQTLKNIILDYYPSWSFEVAIDKTSDGTFEGVQVSKPLDIANQDNDIIYFIIPESAHNEAKELLTKLGKKYVLMKGTNFEFHHEISNLRIS